MISQPPPAAAHCPIACNRTFGISSKDVVLARVWLAGCELDRASGRGLPESASARRQPGFSGNDVTVLDRMTRAPSASSAPFPDIEQALALQGCHHQALQFVCWATTFPTSGISKPLRCLHAFFQAWSGRHCNAAF
ncbi:hypothetical protein HGRIS_011777 [Hohenbuehelia grisea]|uniref:Uncharacterized protein n=1 Tax=Hohenbuehelia grisea TaxID=104357 RepID=A0ABR3JX84_9AGAR